MQRLYYCSEDGSRVLRSETFADDYLVPTSIGGKRADALQASTQSSLVVTGAVDINGRVTYTAFHGGSGTNNIFVEHTAGATGSGNENRPLIMTFDPNDENGLAVVVTFRTDGSGITVTPSSQQVADIINVPALAEVVIAAAGGTGVGDADLLAPTYLGGGADVGDWRKFNDVRGSCRRVNTIKVV